MGNQVSFPCCHTPDAKYEITNGIVAEATSQGLSPERTVAEPASGGKGDGQEEDVGTSEKANKEAAQQQPKAFSTTDPLEVAPELAPQQGLPYQFHVCGPPPPPCDDMRLRTINALKTAGSVRMDADAIDAPPDPEIASILKLVQSIFEAPAALVALFDDRRIFIRDAEGAFQRGDFPWRWSFCGWTMASKNDQIMVIPDATKDARFCNNAMVKSGPGVRFYCGTPLIASNGHRIGTLCFADVKPREFDASRCVVLNNLAELVVRHLEKDIALQLRAHDNNTLMAAYGNLRRTLDCFDHCVALLDTGTAGWRIMFVNNPCCKALGIDRESLQGSYLSRLLAEVDGSMLPSDDHQQAADKGKEFQVEAKLSSVVIEEIETKAAPHDKRQQEDGGGAVAAGTQRFLLTFRPASREDLDQGQIPIGVPNWIPAAPKALPGPTGSTSSDGQEAQTGQRRPDTLYFMLLQDAVRLKAERRAAQAKAAAEAKAAAAVTANASKTSSLLSVGFSHDRELSQPPESISGLTMGHLLGKGAYGSVYYGTWYGTPVAVKIIDEELPHGAESIAPPIEAILSKELRHPHIVATLRCARRIIGPSGSSQGISASASQVLTTVRRGNGGAGAVNSGAGPSRLSPADGSTGAFSDDTARVSQTASMDTGGLGGGSTSGGASCLVPRRGGTPGGSAVVDGQPENGWLGGATAGAHGAGGASHSQLPTSSSGMSGGTAGTSGTSNSVTNSSIAPAGGPSGTASCSAASPSARTTDADGASNACAGADGVFSTAFAVSTPEGAAQADAATAADSHLPPAAGTSENAGQSQSQSQSAWAIINLGASPAGLQATRRRSSTARRSSVGGAGDADGTAADGLLEPPMEGGSGADGASSGTYGSEAYDEFDLGRNSEISPFLLPPGSGAAGSGMAGGHSGMPLHGGASGASGKWTTGEVLVRHQTWLIMEYCDRGCLQDAIDRGWLRTSPALESSGPRMDAVLATAQELASALSFLHSKDIVHGDLSAWNVMLCTSGATAAVGGRNFVAKIADFGLARHLDIRTKIQTRTYGTLTHMPAETLRDGVISKATDVYSLGVLLWQLFTSSRPWAGLRHGQIIVMVVTQGARLRFPPGCPPDFEDLALACMEPDPRCRPTIEHVLAELESIRKDYM